MAEFGHEAVRRDNICKTQCSFVLDAPLGADPNYFIESDTLQAPGGSHSTVLARLFEILTDQNALRIARSLFQTVKDFLNLFTFALLVKAPLLLTFSSTLGEILLLWQPLAFREGYAVEASYCLPNLT